MLTLVSCLVALGHPLLWWDELVTWGMATRSTEELRATLHNVDAVHGTYYLLMQGWIGLVGDTPWAMRLPSTLAMTAATVCVACTGRHLFGNRAGLAAGVLFAVLPAVARYGQEARAYAVVAFVAALATLLLLRAIDQRLGAGAWSVYALVLALLGLLHLVALTLVTAHAVIVLVRTRPGGAPRSGTLTRFGPAALAGVACTIPVVLGGRQQQGRQIAWLPTPRTGDLVAVWPTVFKSALLPTVFLILCLMAAGLQRSRRGEVACCAALIVVPLGAVWALSQGQTSYFDARYLVFTLPAWAVLAGAGVAAIKFRPAIALVLAVALAAAVPGQRDVRGYLAHHWVAYPKPETGPMMDYRGAAQIVSNHHRNGDGIVYDRTGCGYAICDAGVGYYLPRDVQLRDVFLGASAATQGQLHAADCPDPAACIGAEQRLWLIAAGAPPDPFGNLQPAQGQALRWHYSATRTWRVHGLSIFLLQRNGH